MDGLLNLGISRKLKQPSSLYLSMQERIRQLLDLEGPQENRVLSGKPGSTWSSVSEPASDMLMSGILTRPWYRSQEKTSWLPGFVHLTFQSWDASIETRFCYLPCSSDLSHRARLSAAASSLHLVQACSNVLPPKLVQ